MWQNLQLSWSQVRQGGIRPKRPWKEFTTFVRVSKATVGTSEVVLKVLMLTTDRPLAYEGLLGKSVSASGSLSLWCSMEVEASTRL